MVTRRDICILNVAHASNQPDAAILDFASLFNVNYNFENGHLYIYGSSLKEIPHSIRRDYTNCPDIVLTELVCAKILGVELNASGIDHLTYKESDRWTTIHRELGKVGDDLPVFDTHDDHRIAMSLSVLAFIKPIQINNPDVVSKSFPDFWVELKKLGIQIQ
jgi:3-phosphoshikimate 1-carboxyvinyltransferase